MFPTMQKGSMGDINKINSTCSERSESKMPSRPLKTYGSELFG